MQDAVVGEEREDGTAMSVRAPVSIQSDEWETPQWLFDALNAEFGFDFDAAANEVNTKCHNFSYDIKNEQLLAEPNLRIFCNPPYSMIGLFTNTALRTPNLWVFLLPVRTDNGWFRRLIESRHVTIRYFRKRIAFVADGVAMKSPPFASMVVIING